MFARTIDRYLRLTLSRLPVPIRRQYIGDDPLNPLASSTQQFVPVRIDSLKVTKGLRKRILDSRKVINDFSIDRGKRLGIIIPFRDREEHLAKLLPPLRSVLKQQGIDYRVMVVDQARGKMFNRGKCINIGADVLGDEVDYFCIHDVDCVPEQAEYGCPSQPLRLISQWSHTWRNYDLSEVGAFGTVVSMRRDQFVRANGFGNDYWGWGQEDDDFILRCLITGLVPHEDRKGIYRDFDNPESENHQRVKPVRHANKRWQRWQMLLGQLGKNGLSTLDYELLERTDSEDTIRVLVEI